MSSMLCRLGCVVHLYMYGVTSNHTKKLLWYMKHIEIVIEGTEILGQCMNHGGS